MIGRAFVVLGRSLRDYLRDGCMIYAAAMAFYLLTAFVPLCVVIATVVGAVMGGRSGFEAYVTEKLIDMFPSITSTITDELHSLILHESLGSVSIALLGFIAFYLYVAMQKGLEAVFKGAEERRLFGMIFFAALISALLLTLTFVSFVMSSSVTVGVVYLKKAVPGYSVKLFKVVLLKFLIPLLLVQLSAMLIYMIAPKARVRIAHAAIGGGFTAIMLESAKHLYTWYVGSVISLGTIYGSLTAIVVFLLWVYYAASIFLLGGEIVHNLGASSRPGR